MNETPRKLKPLERFRLMMLEASLDRDKNYRERWRRYELEGWLNGVCFVALLGFCIVAWFLFKSAR
ncbi:MAG: hypothetical protein E5V92_08670 [Mesorhizobium sp.]|uniref:hypothetical protein n=1 Tax=Mesorhizobium sp. M1D.F.Ca.ET.043.01.1.1 TaxID=2493669 RepID=UPI000F75748F|nr:hypothetical protein [Mesorhizobium sp. M1D.F.Ca.ET.043.01.1.1]AZO72080.1 hypothetical protein EJ067_13730 [Mesorhizobium sp. M1D.F.Ca.ET.043.01.1.1]RWE09370.1 MAG: hypothetical protein EOS61_17255 [Mesorhizobium sp.]TJW87667.1 MAG: hypothetical protein E5V92_08670 [Mesorhizobium sp.]